MDKRIWPITVVSSFIICSFISLYLFVWRGEFNLYTGNKAIATTAVIVAGLSLLVSFFARRILFFSAYIGLRVTFGWTALFLALAHLFLSMVALRAAFSLQWILNEKYSMAAGFGALFIWLYLAWLSQSAKEAKYGSLWRQMQRWGGRLAFLSICLHILVLKYPSWIVWWNGEVGRYPVAHPGMVPSSLLVIIFMTLCILLITYDFVIGRVSYN